MFILRSWKIIEIPPFIHVQIICPPVLHPVFEPFFGPANRRWANFLDLPNCKSKIYLPIPKTRIYHGRVGRGGARRDSEARRERAGRDADVSVRPEYNRLLYPPDNRKRKPWACLWKHEQTKSHVNRPVEYKTWTYHRRLETGRGAVGRRGGAGTGGTSTGRFARNTTVPVASRQSTKTVLGVSGSMNKGNPTCRVHNSNVLHSGRGGAAHGGASVRGGRRWTGLNADGSIRSGEHRPSCPPRHRRDCPERLFRKH